ncbi:MAG: VCBS repeat-containing protein [Chitinophagales bacterium]
MSKFKLLATTLAILILGVTSCVDNKENNVSSNQNGTNPPIETQFELLRKNKTGLDFENVLIQTLDFNVFGYMYFFNGGGIACGDFNQDGLEDLYFTSNMGPNKLFLNEGNLKFRDVTKAAGMEGMEGWTSGTSTVDFNNDGLLDIYVSQVGKHDNITGRNQLYICKGIEDGIPIFEDQASQYGLDFQVYGTQAAFFDYDLDGDLDMFQLNHSVHDNGTFGEKKGFVGKEHPLSGDKLMRNDNGTYVNVSAQANINSTVIGYGLGIAISDMNLDGYPDIYIANDFHENDYFYINQKDGTFKEVMPEQMMHTSRFSMGTDISDFNNDGWNDIFTLDMAPYDPYILKSSLGEDDYNIFDFKLKYGYHYQYARNNLQLNNQDGTFSEIGMFADVEATDWSWAALFLDFDHDGLKDLFISNGIPRRMNDIDYINFRTGDEDIRFKTNANYLNEGELDLVNKMPQIKLPNKFMRNTGNLRFEDMEAAIEGNATSFSNGAVYVDLDNDGDLDIVTNNIEDEPFVYKNLTIEHKKDRQNYLKLKLEGSPKNRNAIGAKVIAFKGNERISAEQFPVRGYQSSMPMGLHIGVGDTSKVDSILLIWPDRTYQKLEGVDFNQTLNVKWKEGLPNFNFEVLKNKQKKSNPFSFKDITAQTKLDFVHHENPFIEFDRETLIPWMVSAEGPALAVGDVNGDGLEDVFLGSSKRRRSTLYHQNKNGTFTNATPEILVQDSLFEDVDAVFVDIENDGDLDLVIAAGGNEYQGTDEAMRQRLYVNDGKGNFSNKIYFEGAYSVASCVLAQDFNGDGLTDFFFGARSKPWGYGRVGDSYLFVNKGDGKFEDVTDTYHKNLRQVGLVKNGTWADIDQDGDPDLVLAMEWDAIQIFVNQDGKFEQKTVGDYKGWWNFVVAEDFDGDGDLDILAGNMGRNSKLKPTPEQPVRLYVEDFDNNEQVESVMTYYVGGREIPFANYAELTKRMVKLKKRYLYSKDLAKASIEEIFGADKLKSAIKWEANTGVSAYFENAGVEGFKFHPLPNELQFSSLKAAAIMDAEKKNRQKTEVILGGNFYENNVELGRYDANFGNVLSIDDNGNIQLQSYPIGNLSIEGQVRNIARIHIAGKSCFILAKNDAALQVIEAK